MERTGETCEHGLPAATLRGSDGLFRAYHAVEAFDGDQPVTTYKLCRDDDEEIAPPRELGIPIAE